MADRRWRGRRLPPATPLAVHGGVRGGRLEPPAPAEAISQVKRWRPWDSSDMRGRPLAPLLRAGGPAEKLVLTQRRLPASGRRACLARLNNPRRAALACYLQGYSVPEAARFLGWTRKRTEHLVARGLKDLRACLRPRGLHHDECRGRDRELETAVAVAAAGHHACPRLSRAGSHPRRSARRAVGQENRALASHAALRPFCAIA